MVAKVSKTKLMSLKVPVELKDKLDNCRREFLRQGMEINVNSTLVVLLEREVKRMEKELRLKNPNFEHDQQELDV